MASRKEQKEQARAQRMAEEQARQEQERKQRRLRMLGGVVLAAVAIVGVAIAISAGNSGSSGIKTGAQAGKTVTQVENLLSGIPQSGTVLGNPNAKVTMTYYGDLQCPVCQDFTLNGGLPQLIANDVRSGKVKIDYKSFETATRDPSVFQTQQVAALAAGKQSRFWNYAELFYRQQGAEGSGYVTEGFLNTLASQIPGLNMSAWKSARNNPALVSQVSADAQAGSAAGVQGTPTLIFEGPKGKTQSPESVPSYGQLQQAIQSVS
jgi:protein-disulfide isomerase